MIRVEELDLTGLLLVTPEVHVDERGSFHERWRASAYERHRIGPFVQANLSRSGRGVLRGLHWQVPPHAQGKLVSVATGEILDVVVDLRQGSRTFGRWAGVRLDDREHRQLWVPPGFAHGFLVRSERADVLYETTAEYAPDAERGLAWDDPDVAIDWGTDDPPLVSARDRNRPRLTELGPTALFTWGGET